MFGFLNVDKPPGITSRDVVNRVQKLVKPHKVGHAGTLDPLATGVLVVAIGPATRLIEHVQQMPKTYLGAFLLGRTSDTEDVDGNVTELHSPPIPTLSDVLAIVPQFIGSIQQRPPAYSALKVAGQRAYDLVRRGETVNLTPRTIEVIQIEVVRYDYPALQLRVQCGSGTYVRSLGRDLAEALGNGAVMSALQREAIGPFVVQDALSYESLTAANIPQRLLPASMALGNLAQVVVDHDEAARLVRGQSIINRFRVAASEAAATDSEGRLVALLASIGKMEWRPTKVFTTD